MKNSLKEHVGEDVKRDISKKREYQKKLFNQKYNNPKIYKFPKVSDINVHRFFCFPKFSKRFWMPKDALAVYPVLCLLTDFEENKWFQISQKNIAIMAGVSVNTVAKGIQALEKLNLDGEPYLEKKKQTLGQRHFYVYRVNYYRKNDMIDHEGNYFLFHKCIVESVVWADLKPRAKALYVSMRMRAHFDAELYEELEDFDIEINSIDDFDLYEEHIYKERKWEVCHTSLAQLCRNVNIKPINLRTIIDQLEYHRLIERVDRSIFKVYLRPKM